MINSITTMHTKIIVENVLAILVLTFQSKMHVPKVFKPINEETCLWNFWYQGNLLSNIPSNPGNNYIWQGALTHTHTHTHTQTNKHYTPPFKYTNAQWTNRVNYRLTALLISLIPTLYYSFFTILNSAKSLQSLLESQFANLKHIFKSEAFL